MNRKKLDVASSVERARNEANWHQLAIIADSIREESKLSTALLLHYDNITTPMLIR